MASASATLIDDAPRFPEFVVKMSMYRSNRQKLLARFQAIAKTGIILTEGGQVCIPKDLLFA